MPDGLITCKVKGVPVNYDGTTWRSEIPEIAEFLNTQERMARFEGRLDGYFPYPARARALIALERSGWRYEDFQDDLSEIDPRPKPNRVY